MSLLLTANRVPATVFSNRRAASQSLLSRGLSTASEQMIVESQTNLVSDQTVAPSHSAHVGWSTASSDQVSDDTRSKTPLAKSRPSSGKSNSLDI